MLDENSPILKVNEVAKQLKISADRLRTYDEEHLIAPSRGEHNVRLYSLNDINWLENLRKLISAKPSISILGFKSILKLLYFMSDEEFENFLKKQDKNSIWHTIDQMKKNPNYEKLKQFYL